MRPLRSVDGHLGLSNESRDSTNTDDRIYLICFGINGTSASLIARIGPSSCLNSILPFSSLLVKILVPVGSSNVGSSSGPG